MSNKYLEFSKKGYIGTINGKIYDDDGKVVYDSKSLNFIGDNDKNPSTVNKDLWEQCKKLKYNGLFEVIEGKIYQVRGLDLANMTFIRTGEKWIIIDVLTSYETAQESIKLFEKYLGNVYYDSIIISHSHADHFGGIEGVISYIGYKPNIIVPENFLKESIIENIFTGNSVHRRSSYMYGTFLKSSPTGQMSTGLGTSISKGKKSITYPDITIDQDFVSLKFEDNFDITFINTPGAEAPSEMMMYLPKYKSLFTSEIVNFTMHNLYTLRGSKTRNGLIWSKHIDKIIMLYGDDTEISFGAHHWPVFGKDLVKNYWIKQRDLYRFIHDQCLRLGNNGFDMDQIANMVKLPESLSREDFNKEYYGSLSHNLKGQYQLYFGWFNGNPAHLNPLPDPEESIKYVEMMGGPALMINKIHDFIKNGELRWSATLLNKIIMSDPSNITAKKILSDVYIKLGYEQVNAVWRNFYLSAAFELIYGKIHSHNTKEDKDSMISYMDLETFSDLLAMRINPQKSSGKTLKMFVIFTDIKDTLYLELSNDTLINRINYDSPDLDIELTTSIEYFKYFLLSGKYQQPIDKNKISMIGDVKKFYVLIDILENPDVNFDIVLPNM